MKLDLKKQVRTVASLRIGDHFTLESTRRRAIRTGNGFVILDGPDAGLLCEGSGYLEREVEDVAPELPEPATRPTRAAWYSDGEVLALRFRARVLYFNKYGRYGGSDRLDCLTSDFKPLSEGKITAFEGTWLDEQPASE